MDNDNFDPNDHNIENDEIAKIYAEADMKEERREWIKGRVNTFYNDFDKLSIDGAVERLKALVNSKSISNKEALVFIDNMIEVFSSEEEYEKCAVCAKIKIKLEC